MKKKVLIIKDKIYQLILLIALVVFSFFIGKYLVWGINEIKEYFPSYDEHLNLSIVGNIARYNEFVTSYSYHNMPAIFNPFLSTGLTLILPLAFIVKIFGFTWQTVSASIFFGINLPLLVIFMSYIWVSAKKELFLRKAFLSMAFIILLITNRLFYSSPPTGGSFTHGVLGEPIGLAFNLLSIFFLYFGVRKSQLRYYVLAGITSFLAFESKTVSIILTFGQLLSIIVLNLFTLKNKDDLLAYLKKIIAFIGSFFLLFFVYTLWKKTFFTPEQYSLFQCWNKTFMLNNGSGLKIAQNFQLNKILEYIQPKFDETVNFFTKFIHPRWYVSSQKKVIILLITFIVFYIVGMIRIIGLFFKRIKELKNQTKIDDFFLIVTLSLSFSLGSVWFYVFEDYSWIRHYYIFFFIGILTIFLIYLKILPRIVFDFILIFIVGWTLVQYYNRTPFYSLSFPERPLIKHIIAEETDFYNYYSKLPPKKTYVCGDSSTDIMTFLFGARFKNNILEDSYNIYPKCNKFPNAKLKKIQDKEFYFIYQYGSQEALCNQFTIDNRPNMKLLFNKRLELYLFNNKLNNE